MAFTDLIGTISDDPAPEPAETPADPPEPVADPPAEPAGKGKQAAGADLTKDEPESEMDTEDPDAEPVEGDTTGDEEPDAPVSIDMAAKYKIGDEELTGREVQDRMMMRAAFTQKTQALSEERKAFQAEMEKREETDVEVGAFIHDLQDPQTMRYALESRFPQVYQAMVDQILDDAIRLGGAAESEQNLILELHRDRVRQWAANRQAHIRQAIEESKADRQTRSTIQENVKKWKISSMQAHGLDPRDADHAGLLAEAMVARHRDKTWTEELFNTEAARIARLLRVKKKMETKEKSATKSGDKIPSEAPPVRTLPPVKVAPGSKGTPAPEAPVKHSVENVFSKIRKKHGMAY